MSTHKRTDIEASRPSIAIHVLECVADCRGVQRLQTIQYFLANFSHMILLLLVGLCVG